MNRLPIFSEVRIEYPTIKDKFFHKYHYVDGVILEYIDDNTVCVDISGNTEWNLDKISKECRYNKMDELKIWDWKTITRKKADSITITCPAVHIRKHMVLITEEHDLKNNTVKIERKNDCTALRYPNPGGYSFKSSGLYSFLKDTFDLLITGVKEERVYTSSRWNKPYYKSVRYFTPESIDM